MTTPIVIDSTFTGPAAMVEAAYEVLQHPAVDYRPTVRDGLIAALNAFADDLGRMAAEARESGKHGSKTKAATLEAAENILRQRAQALEVLPMSRPAGSSEKTLGTEPFSAVTPAPDPFATLDGRTEIDRREEVLDHMAALAAKNPFVGGHAPSESGQDEPQVSDLQTESTALEVQQSDATLCGIADAMGYVCEREQHPPGTGPHEMYRGYGEVSARWPDERPVEAPENGTVRFLTPEGVREQIADFITGRTDELPALDGAPPVLDLGPISAEVGAAIFSAPPFNLGPVEPDPFGSVQWGDDPFASANDSPSPPPWRLDPDPRPLALDPAVARPAPDHVSYSQIKLAGECGLQLRLKKRDEGVYEQPAMWNAGGTAFHAVAERHERARIANPILFEHCDDRPAFPDSFDPQLSLTIAEAEAENEITRDRWRIAQKGAETEVWWRINGPLMLRDYAAWSFQRHADGWQIFNLAGPDRIGLELEFDVPVGRDVQTGETVNVNVRIDQVWMRWEDGRLHLHIEDLKSGAKPVLDTFQLGVYAHGLTRWLRTFLPDTIVENVLVTGSYYDARNGKSSDPIEPLTLHSWEEIEYRALTTFGMHAANIYPANPNPSYGGPCGLCDVRHHCPIMALR